MHGSLTLDLAHAFFPITPHHCRPSLQCCVSSGPTGQLVRMHIVYARPSPHLLDCREARWFMLADLGAECLPSSPSLPPPPACCALRPLMQHPARYKVTLRTQKGDGYWFNRLQTLSFPKSPPKSQGCDSPPPPGTSFSSGVPPAQFGNDDDVASPTLLLIPMRSL